MSVQLRAQLADVKKHLADARQRYKEVDFALKYTRGQLNEIQRQDASIATLGRILEDIRKLEQQDSIQLLWGETCTDSEAEQKRRRLEVSLRDYDTRVSTTQHRIRMLLDERNRLDRTIDELEAQQEQLIDLLSRVTDEATLEAELHQAFSSQVVLPWSNKRNDAFRLRAIMAATLVVALLLTIIVPLWEIPEPERIETIEIPERLATLIVKKPPPPPPPPEPEQPPEEEAEQPEAAEEQPKPEEPEKSEARKSAEKAGLLAFRQDFSEIMDASANIKMGSQATILTKGPAQRRTPASRSLITSNVEFSRAGAPPTVVARTDVIGDENKLKQVEFTHVESTEVAVLDAQQTPPKTKRGAPRRTDEEIQLVFDRYKEALYRIYNRELRKNSFLKGKLVLQLTIEPNGSVSKCTVASSDLNSEELEKKIVARVMRFNFGTRKGAKPMTIRYPIDFLPAT